MKITVCEEGLDIFVPDEEITELYMVISRSTHQGYYMKSGLLQEIERLIPYKELERLRP